MNGGSPASDPPVRRERKRWDKDGPTVSLFVNEAELSKWTSRKASDPPSKPTSSPSSTLFSSSTLQKSTLTKSITTPTSSPTLPRSLSKPQLSNSSSSPKPARARPQSPRITPPSPRPPSPAPSRPTASPSSPSSRPTAPSPAPTSLAKQRERFKSPLRAPPKPPEPVEKEPPLPKLKPATTTPTSSSPIHNTPQPAQSQAQSPPGKQDLSDKTKIVNFMCGVLKIFAHLAGLPEGSEKQKEVKLAALEKRCKERLPPGLCSSILDVLNDFRFLNALYDLPDQIDDIKATTQEFEKKVNQFVSIVSAKFGGMDLMKEQSTALMGNSTKKIQICSCKIALRAALQTENEVVIIETLHKCRQVGMDLDMLELAQNLAKCVKADTGITVQEIAKYKALIQRAVTLRVLEESFAATLTKRLDQTDECLRNLEAVANVAAQDGNLAPFREALEKAKSAHAAPGDLALYLEVHQDLQARLQVVREIVVATKERHQTKLQQALDKARTTRQFECDEVRNKPESTMLKLMLEGETGVHKMLRDAVQSGASVLSHLEAVAAVRALLESSVSTEDKAGLEDVVTRGSALGMTREVEAARNALRAMDRIRIKCHLHTDIRILSVPRDTQFPDLKAKIEQTYGATSAFVMKYRDDVGDLITLASHEDLTNALLTMDASVETPAGTRRGTGPKLDVFLAVPASSVRSSIEVKERARTAAASRVHPNTQLAASVQQLYELLSSNPRTSSPQPLPGSSLYPPPTPLPSSLYPPSTPSLPSSLPSSLYPPPTSLSPTTSPPLSRSHHYDHLIDLNAEKEKNNKPSYASFSNGQQNGSASFSTNNYVNLSNNGAPPKTAKSSKHKRSKSRESSDRLFVSGKSVNT